jgi:hypothetical protein
MLIQGQVGQPSPTTIQPGTTPTLRLGGMADQIVSQLQGRYYENCYRNNMFALSTIALGTTIVAANVSPVGAAAAPMFAMYNPAGSGKNAVISRIIVNTLSGTPGGPFVLNVIPPNAGITAVANLTAINLATLVAAGSVMRGFVQTALTGGAQSVMLRALGGPGAVAVGAGIYSVAEETAGDLIIPPGGALILAVTATGTTHIAAASFVYTEVPV